MFKWMSCSTLNVRIKNENIQGKLEAALIEDKMRKNRLRWFWHVYRRLTDGTIEELIIFGG